MNTFWNTLASRLDSGHNVFLALVAKHTLHSPGTTGAKLMVSESFEQVGTIGGGIMEYRLLKWAHEVLGQKDFSPQVQTLTHRKQGMGEKSGMICAGTQTNVYYLCRPEKDAKTVGEVARLVENDSPATLSITPSGMVLDDGKRNPSFPQIRLTYADGSWAYQEQLFNLKRIAIIGGGHCSLALSRVMKNLGYEVFVFDTREDVFTVRDNRYARQIRIVKDYRDAGPMIKHPDLMHVVVMTTDVASDVRGLLGVLDLPVPFIGVMGSKAKIAEIFKNLRAERILESRLSRLTAPVGLPMVSNTPEEIAISVAAQILQKRDRREQG